MRTSILAGCACFPLAITSNTLSRSSPHPQGFLCPVHTPDGTPCGLLNHLSRSAYGVTHATSAAALPQLLFSLGVSRLGLATSATDLDVVLDGRMLGSIERKKAGHLAEQLRVLKVGADKRVPTTLEVAYVPPSERGQFPGGCI